MQEFRLVQGISVPNLEGIEEGYSVQETQGGWTFQVNVSAERMDPLFRALCALVREPGFLVLEHGTNRELEKELRKSESDPFHKDIFFLDGMSQQAFLALYNAYAELLVNDGEICYGFGSHSGTDEVYVGAYKMVTIYADDPQKYAQALADMGYIRRERLKTVWENFSPDTPGGRMCVKKNGVGIYDMVKALGEKGLYLAQRREDG